MPILRRWSAFGIQPISVSTPYSPCVVRFIHLLPASLFTVGFLPAIFTERSLFGFSKTYWCLHFDPPQTLDGFALVVKSKDQDRVFAHFSYRKSLPIGNNEEV